MVVYNKNKGFIIILLIFVITGFIWSSETRLPVGFAFLMGFPGTFYTWDTFGGTAEENMRRPYSSKFARNYMPEIFYNAFRNSTAPLDTNELSAYLESTYFPDWGGQNRDRSFIPLKGRVDLLDKWCFDYLRLAEQFRNENKEAVIICGFSHGNQTAIELFNQLEEYGILYDGTVYVAFSRPNRVDHQLTRGALSILGKNFINIYNLKDTVIGGDKFFDKSSKFDLFPPYFDMDGKPISNIVYDPYSPEAVNFVLDEYVDYFGNHCLPLGRELVLAAIIDYFKDNYNSIKIGDLFKVSYYPVETAAIIIPGRLKLREYEYYFDNPGMPDLSGKVKEYYQIILPGLKRSHYRKLLKKASNEEKKIIESHYSFSNEVNKYLCSNLNDNSLRRQIWGILALNGYVESMLFDPAENLTFEEKTTIQEYFNTL